MFSSMVQIQLQQASALGTRPPRSTSVVTSKRATVRTRASRASLQDGAGRASPSARTGESLPGESSSGQASFVQSAQAKPERGDKSASFLHPVGIPEYTLASWPQ